MHEVMPEAFRFTRALYNRMGEAGILREDDRVELIRGEILVMSPPGPTHSSVLEFLVRWFGRSLPEAYSYRVQDPIALGEYSQPQPDLAVVRFHADGQRTEHPGPADVLLVVEVSGSTLQYDLGPKADLYAAAQIPEYWVLDVTSLRAHVHREPSHGRYERVTVLERGVELTPISVPGFRIPLSFVFR